MPIAGVGRRFIRECGRNFPRNFIYFRLFGKTGNFAALEMAFRSIKSVLAEAELVPPTQFEEWSKAWRVAVENGSPESLLSFFWRERGLSEEAFLQRLAQALGWAYLDLPHINPPNEVRQKISTKVAF